MNQPITAESLAALRQSSEILAAVCDRAAKCEHLEARNKHLQESNDGIAARHGVLQAVIRKAREGLGNVIPECRHMSLPELVIEAAGRIQNLREAAAAPKPAPTSGDAVSIALRLARHPLNDLGRVELGTAMIPHLRPGENIDTGALRILADRVEWLEKEAEECRVMLHDVSAGRVDSRLRREATAAFDHLTAERDAYARDFRAVSDALRERTDERDAARGATLATLPEAELIAIDELKASRRQLRAAIDKACEGLGNVLPEWKGQSIHELVLAAGATIDRLRSDATTDRETIGRLDAGMLAMQSAFMDRHVAWETERSRLTAELAEARAENGRQAATIAAPLRLEVGKTYVRRDGGLETIFTCGAGRDWPYEATSGLRYAPDGGFSFFRDQEHHADLVALAPTVDPASPHP